MCSLFGSTDKKLFNELAMLNEYRGTHSHSFATYDGTTVDNVRKAFGQYKDININGRFYIGHQQAPTTESKNEASIHPANYKGSLLWHNGIIKDTQIKAWQKTYSREEKWDTAWLVRLLASNNPMEILRNTNGSFACVWYHPHRSSLSIFRNENCPLYIKGSSYSSTKFENSIELEPNIVYNLNRDMTNWVKTQDEFETKETFFWSPV